MTHPEEEQDDRSLLDGIRTGDYLQNTDFPPLAWMIHGLIPEGFGLFTGAPKTGKSWAVLGIGLAVAAGGKALGKVPTGNPRPVLLLALEDGERRLKGRCKALLGEINPIPSDLHYITDTTPALILPTVQEWLIENSDGLVILDTLGKVMPNALPGEGAYQRDYRTGTALKNTIDAHPGATLLVVHHVRKQGSDDWMDSTSGTNGLNGAADFTINLYRERNSTTGMLRVTGRDVVEAEYAVNTDNGTWTLDGDDLMDAAEKAYEHQAVINLGDRAAAIYQYVSTQDQPVYARDVDEALDMTNARRYLARMVDAGRLRRAQRGTYTVPTVPSVPNGTIPLATTVPSVPTVPSRGISPSQTTNHTWDTHEVPLSQVSQVKESPDSLDVSQGKYGTHGTHQHGTTNNNHNPTTRTNTPNGTHGTHGTGVHGTDQDTTPCPTCNNPMPTHRAQTGTNCADCQTHTIDQAFQEWEDSLLN